MHTIAATFFATCQEHHRHTAEHCADARVDAYKQLIDRYGYDRVLRHVAAIRRALTTIEARSQA